MIASIFFLALASVPDAPSEVLPERRSGSYHHGERRAMANLSKSPWNGDMAELTPELRSVCLEIRQAGQMESM
jgi:hypothetical protein